jgi:hypothetical protein
MEQFHNSDNSGMVGFLVGIIVLVFAGILFSLMADKRFRFSNNRISIEDQVAEGANELADAKTRLENLRKTWRESYEPLASQGNSAQTAAAAVKAGEARLAALREEKTAAAAAVSAATLAFDDYTGRYRVQVRGAAVGEKLPELKSRSGKVYKDVTIRKVSAAGIEILHEHGNSRLLPEDLEPSWHERFQWSRAEVLKVLEDERLRQERHNQLVDGGGDDANPPGKGSGKPKPKDKDKDKAEPEDSKLQDLREEVMQTRNRYLAAQNEAIRARSEADGYNRGKSVPGSLETWAQRASRLEGVASKLRGQYMTARGKLAALAPRDSLLQQVEE